MHQQQQEPLGQLSRQRPHPKRLQKISFIGVAALLLTLLLPLQAFAQQPTISLRPTTGAPGTRVTVQGSGWTPGEEVFISFGVAGRHVAQVTPSTGTFTTTFVVPASAAKGEQRVLAGTEDVSVQATAPFTVNGEAPPDKKDEDKEKGKGKKGKRNQVVIFLQGISTGLTSEQIDKQIKTDHKDAKAIVGLGDIPATFSDELRADAQFFQYSYEGSEPITGNPVPYNCQATFRNPISTNVARLARQISTILATKPEGTGTDLYLVGHSLGGVVAYAYGALVAHPTQTPTLPAPLLPSGARLKGVVTLDSPIGGISNHPSYPAFALQVFSATVPIFGELNPRKCPGLKDLPTLDQTQALGDLTILFNTAREQGPTQGGSASVLRGLLGVTSDNRQKVSNQQVAKDLAEAGTGVLTIGNKNDFLWNPKRCEAARGIDELLGVEVPEVNFTDTQWVKDKANGDPGAYGRSFEGGDGTCTISLLKSLFGAELNHSKVLSDEDVQGGISEFLPDGGEPTELKAER